MELCKPLHVQTAERLPHGLKLPGNTALDGFRERRSLQAVTLLLIPQFDIGEQPQLLLKGGLRFG